MAGLVPIKDHQAKRVLGLAKGTDLLPTISSALALEIEDAFYR